MSNRKGKNTLQGFGSPATSGQANFAEALKKIGQIIGTKGIRPVGGNIQGVTGGAKGGGGEVKLKPIGGGKGIAGGGGGPKAMPSDGNPTLTTTELGSMGKSGLGKKNVRETP